MTSVSDVEIHVPLVVDLDGTLTLSDTLYESFAKFLFQNPVAALGCALHLTRGPAAVKHYIAEHCRLDSCDVAVPNRAYRNRESRNGARTRSPSRDRRRSDDRGRCRAPSRPVRVSNRQRRPAQFERSKQARAPPGQISRAGTSTRATAAPTCRRFAAHAASSCAMWPVRPLPRLLRQEFRCSRRCAVSKSGAGLAARPPRAPMGEESPAVRAAVRRTRVRRSRRPSRRSALGFVLLCLLSSATYIVNDLADLDADRAHATKRLRPFASGSLKIIHGLIAAPLMIAAALAGAVALSPPFAGALLAYLVLTTAYSFGLKRVALLDVFVIGVLFTLRIVMGAEVVGLAHSAWLLSFALAFFISLALSKRHGEVMRAASADAGEIAGRGYRGNDWPVTLTFGIGIGLVSVVIMLLYMTNDAAPSGFYHRPGLLYAIPALLTLWLMRIWLLSHRMELHDDPVVFALRDRSALCSASRSRSRSILAL